MAAGNRARESSGGAAGWGNAAEVGRVTGRYQRTTLMLGIGVLFALSVMGGNSRGEDTASLYLQLMVFMFLDWFFSRGHA